MSIGLTLLSKKKRMNMSLGAMKGTPKTRFVLIAK